jgi:arylsulfatase A-like enzyme
MNLHNLSPSKKRPNIIFVVADDLGFADLGCYGGRPATFGLVSPVLDALAAQGLKLTQGYSNSPVCSPTRFALMTARYQYRLRGAAEEPINSKSRGSTSLGLPPAHPTLPSLLRSGGYRTALIGKWHLGYPPSFGPTRSGYDEFFGPMAGGGGLLHPLRFQWHAVVSQHFSEESELLRLETRIRIF